MNIPTLLEDLIREFRIGRKTNLQAIEQTDQIVAKLKKPFAYRFFQTGLSLFLELLLWIGTVTCFAVIIFMERLYPFSILGHLSINPDASQITQHDMNILVWTLRAVFLLFGFTFLWVARLLAKVRRAGKFLTTINKDLKGLMEPLLRRRSTFQELTLKYPVDLAEDADSIVLPELLPSTGNNSVQKGHDDILL